METGFCKCEFQCTFRLTFSVLVLEGNKTQNFQLARSSRFLVHSWLVIRPSLNQIRKKKCFTFKMFCGAGFQAWSILKPSNYHTKIFTFWVSKCLSEKLDFHSVEMFPCKMVKITAISSTEYNSCI